MLTELVTAPRPRPALTSTELPAPYCPVPRKMLSDLRDNPLAIGLYLLIARLYLVTHAPIPLGRADVLAFDPSLKAGAVKRAFDRLIVSGWLVGSTAPTSTKRHYTPTWGVVGGAERQWSLDAPALGRPRHVEAVRVNRDLLDIGLGRLDPHPRHAAEVTRYLVAPALSLADLGAYALVVAELGRATPALTTLGLVVDNQVSVVPTASVLLSQLTQCSGIELSEQGRKKLGMSSATRQNVIGHQIGGVIGQLIGSAAKRDPAFCASERAEQPRRASRPSIPGRSSDSSDFPTPPPTPAEPGGGLRVLCGRQAERPRLVPDTEATRLLGTIAVRPAQQIELASMPPEAVEVAIADGKARGGIRDLAGWVVYLLRQRRDHGWTPPAPAPRADAPEVLGAYFAQRVAEQEVQREAEQTDDALPDHSAEMANTAIFPLSPKAKQLTSLADVWEDTLVGLRLRLPRDVYQACVRQATLRSYIDGVAAIGVSDTGLKDTLERGYLAALRFALSDALGREVAVRVVLT